MKRARKLARFIGSTLIRFGENQKESASVQGVEQDGPAESSITQRFNGNAVESVVKPSPDATANSSEIATNPVQNRVPQAESHRKAIAIVERRTKSASPRHSLVSQETGASTPPLENEAEDGRHLSTAPQPGSSTRPIDNDDIAEDARFAYNLRSPTFPTKVVEGSGRTLPFLQPGFLSPSAANYTSPTSNAFPKSPAPSVSESDLMDEIMPHKISVSVTVTWQENEDVHQPEIIDDFLWIYTKSYNELLPHKLYEKYQNAFGNLRDRKIYFRYGSCRVRSAPELQYETPYKILIEDRAECLADAAIEIICGFISAHPRQPFSLEVYWDAGAARLSPIPGQAESFSQLIQNEMWEKRRKNFKGQAYIPLRDQNVFQQHGIVNQLVLQDATLGHLSDDAKNSFVNELVQRPALKIWMICVERQLTMRFLHHLLFEHDGRDANPLDAHSSCSDHLCQTRRAQVLESLSMVKVNRIVRDYRHRIVPSTEVMPLLWTGKTSGSQSEKEELGKGATSNVYRVRIDCSHHYLSGDPMCEFALKVFSNLRDREFKREISMLCMLANYPDDHIVLHIQSWTQDDEHYILYPKAAYNLRGFMRHYHRVGFSRSDVLWFLRQLEGLAKALKHVHNLMQPTNTDPNPTKPIWCGCHYDIKPENILVFEKEPSHYPVFKISDFGVGVFNAARAPGEDSVLTREAKGTETYFAPEASDIRGVSRPSDMWALGCVYLELMVWLFGFFESGEGFSTKRFNCTGADDKNKHDGFWIKNANGAYDLNPEVKKALTELRKSHCGQMRAFLRVLKAIKGLLRVNPKQRWDADRLVSYLGNTIRQATGDLEEHPDFYTLQYAANTDGKPTPTGLRSERIDPDKGSKISTRSASPTSPEVRQSPSNVRPRSSTARSSQALLQTGSGTDHTSGSYNIAGDNPSTTHDDLQRELSAIPVAL